MKGFMWNLVVFVIKSLVYLAVCSGFFAFAIAAVWLNEYWMALFFATGGAAMFAIYVNEVREYLGE